VGSANRRSQHSRVAASRSSSPADDGSDAAASAHLADENPASSSHAAESSSAAGAAAAAQQQPADSPFLALPLLVASSLSHVNRQYIKMRRRRKWWSKMGGYPKVRARCGTPLQCLVHPQVVCAPCLALG
jgi:hypothetical protein